MAHLLSSTTRLLAAATVCLLGGCTAMTPGWDARFGDSVRMATATQVMHPDASRNANPVNGIDGRAASESTKRYYKSFQEPPPPAPLFQILGTGGAGGAGGQ